MKKILFTVVMVLISLTVFAMAMDESTEKSVSLAVMQGPTGFSSAGLPDWIDVQIFPSPVEAVSNLVNGTLDMAVIPANKAAILYQKGMAIKVVAIVGEGMLSIVGSDDNNSTLSVPGAGDTPDLLSTLLYPEYEKDYSVTSPAQIAQLLIAGKKDLAIIPQPFVNKVLSANKNIKVISDVSTRWAQYSGLEQYPMSVLVCSDSFARENSKLVQIVSEEYEKSVNWVNNNVEKAGEKIEALGIMAKELARMSIKDCKLVFKSSNTAKEELKTYLNIVMDSVPDDGFFL